MSSVKIYVKSLSFDRFTYNQHSDVLHCYVTPAVKIIAVSPSEDC